MVRGAVRVGTAICDVKITMDKYDVISDAYKERIDQFSREFCQRKYDEFLAADKERLERFSREWCQRKGLGVTTQEDSERLRAEVGWPLYTFSCENHDDWR